VCGPESCCRVCFNTHLEVKSTQSRQNASKESRSDVRFQAFLLPVIESVFQVRGSLVFNLATQARFRLEFRLVLFISSTETLSLAWEKTTKFQAFK
jgi:hypothetical protein